MGELKVNRVPRFLQLRWEKEKERKKKKGVGKSGRKKEKQTKQTYAKRREALSTKK